MTDTVRESSSGKGEVAMATDRQMALFGCDLVDLLRREGRHSGVWFADRLLQAADALEALSTPDRARVEVLEEAARVAEQWRDENKAACSKARPTDSRQADRLYGAAVECNAIAAAIRALAHTTAVSGE